MKLTAVAAFVQNVRFPAFWARIKTWVGKASLAVLDQGVMTGSNFIVGVLLARWLAPAQYGAYAIAYALFLLLSLIFQALILEPMSVFGPSTYRERLREYFGILLRVYIGLSLLLLLVLGVSSWVEGRLMHANALSSAIAGIAVATPCILLLWLTRNAFYVKLSPKGSMVGGCLYGVLLLLGILVLQRRGQISPLTVFLLMAATALVAALVQFIRLKPVYRAGPGMTLRSVCVQHWSYGRWILASSFVVWIPSNIYYVLFSGHSMMLPAAELRALLNLTLPVGQTATALSLLAQPYAAQRESSHVSASVISLVRKVTVLFAAGAAGYWVILVLFSTQALHALYADKYTGLSPLVPWVGLSSILAVAAHGPGIGLRAVRSTSSVFAAFCVSSGITVCVGIPATLIFGVPGAVATLVLANGVAVVLVFRFFYRRVEQSRIELNACPASIMPLVDQ